MSKIIVPIAEGFEEIEAVCIIDVCRRAGIEVVTAGVETLSVKGANAITIETDLLLNDVDSTDIDMIVLPGGGKGTEILASNKQVQHLLKEFKQKDKLIGAICAAPYALHTAGVLNQNYTCYPSFEKKIRIEGYEATKKVVIDGKVITSRGPGTAICFALEIVKTLCGEKTYEGIKQGVLASYC